MVMGNLMPEDAKDEMPAIGALDVVCNKEMMNVSMQFDKEFEGVIYSKVIWFLEICCRNYTSLLQRHEFFLV